LIEKTFRISAATSIEALAFSHSFGYPFADKLSQSGTQTCRCLCPLAWRSNDEEAVEFAKTSKRENWVYVGNLSYDVKYRDLMEFMRGGGWGNLRLVF